MRESPFSFCRFTFPIFKKGMKKDFEYEDLYNTLKKDRSTVLGDKLESNWKIQNSKTDRKRSLLKALWHSYRSEYLSLGLMTFFGDVVIKISQPYVLGLLLNYYNSDSSITKDRAFAYAGLIVLLNTLTSFMKNQYTMYSMHTGMRARASVTALIYRKALKLSQTAIGKNSIGKIVNLISNDVSRFDTASTLIHQLWVGPLSALIIMFIIYQDIGWSGAPGVLTILVIMPLQIYIGKLSAKYRRITAMKTDERIRLMDEVIGGVQVIKMYAWEKPFEKLIAAARRAELNIIKRGQYVRGFFMACNLFNNRFALFVTLITMVFTGKAITASRVYVFMSYYQILAQTLAGVFVSGITQFAELLVSIGRIQNFLENEEYRSQRVLNKRSSNPEDDVLVLKNVTATYDRNSSDEILKNINVKATKDSLIGIIGPVGSGKSSLLQTILGELDILEGSVTVNGTVSYISQEPWIFSASIRQNILFGSKYDKSRYDEVLRVCALETDLKQFPDRDLTLIGEKGANLSGGQKARVSLARGIYKDADIYLLDDPLSAVDILVSKVLYDDCIKGFLKEKVRVLVTHQVHYLTNANRVLVLNHGNIEIEGSYSELVKSDNPLTVHLREEAAELIKRQLSLTESLEEESSKLKSNKEDELEKNINDKMQEKTSKGTVEGSLLLRYFQSGMSLAEIIFLGVLLVVAQSAATVNDWFISFWTNIEESRSVNSTITSEQPFYMSWSSNTCLALYGAVLVFCLVTTISRSLLFFKFVMSCAESLHLMLYKGVTGAYMRFFDQNPSGRILNRFSKDMGNVDESLPMLLFNCSRMFLKMLGHVLLVIYISPYTIIVMVFLSIVFSILRSIYLRSSTNIKRLEGRTKSPVFNHLMASLQGLTTIRAFRAEEVLRAEFDKHQDFHSSSWFMFISTSSAFGFALDFICLVFISSITFGLIALGDYFGLTGSDVGLAINQASALTANIQFLVRFSADVSNQLMSVERVLEYNELEPELQPVNPLTPVKGWPDRGNIKIDNLSMKYMEDGPVVLNDISIDIKPNEKVGVVGRTGAGKSSLIGALFRLVKTEGKIRIDGIDTREISLEKLRSNISIIPQDPILFSGTLRYNLDPFDEFKDDLLYKTLDEVELKDPNNVVNRLENRVMDRGLNYSVGQRQLICLARAIIRNNKILVLDEATANVDPQTDALIQKTIREKFSDCTVLTVAHRLHTIIDSDKVLVLDNGEVKEFDHPHVLLQNKYGAFRKMVEETGHSTLKLFQETCRLNYESKGH
ncbi:unnamed protein product [Phyllotreta striolata]|uniref:Uncharacterized protein n=1 Tax=Phyllotreta striolata TaxID=444603 RepID=A0A9P0DV74_PHYSR|nr:unnamed protein product [Phyllotreta striolata]